MSIRLAPASGWGVGALAGQAGWAAAFRVLALVAAAAAMATVAYWLLQRRTVSAPASVVASGGSS